MKYSVLAPLLLFCAGASLSQEVKDRDEYWGAGVGRTPPAFSAFSITTGKEPRVMFSGQVFESDIEARNDSSVPWEPAQGVSLSYRWMSRDGDAVPGLEQNFEIGESVAPGGAVELRVRVRSPEKAGLYRLQWDMRHSDLGWFSQWTNVPAPASLVLVLPPRGPLIAAIIPIFTALFGLVLVWISARRPKSGWLIDSVALTDLAWCFSSLISKPYLLFEELSISHFPVAGWLSIGHVAIVLLALLFLPQRVRPVLSWIVVGLGSLSIWADLLHYRFFGDLISTPALLAVRQTGELGEVVTELAKSRDWVLFLDLFVAIPLVVTLVKKAPRSTPWLRRVRQLSLVLLAGVVITSASVAWRRSDPGFGTISGPELKTVESVGEYGLYGFRLQDLFYQTRRHLSRRSITEPELAGTLEWFEERAAAYAPGSSFGVARGMNLLLIQVEAMQQFVLDFTIDGQEITPNLNRLKGSAVAFTAVQDQTGKGRSSAGEFVALTSIIPVVDSVAFQYPGNEYVTPATVLLQHGYSTLASVPYRRSFWNRHLTHPAFGFADGLYVEEFELGEKVGWGLNDREFFRQMVPHIEQMPRPFLVWLTTLSLHYPYSNFPDSLKSLSMGDLEGTALGNYLHGMSLFDRAFGELVESLQATGLLEQTVIALWGDHDSRLVSRDQTTEGIQLSESWPEWYLFDRVPFLIWVPGDVGPRGTDAVTAGQLDIAPTLLSLMGIDPSGYPFMGRDLLSEPIDRPVVHPDGSWIDGRHLQVKGGKRTSGCWDLETRKRVSDLLCQPGVQEAASQLEISDRLLLKNLQGRISKLLQAPP
jgi:lipoteichoic acid synthase